MAKRFVRLSDQEKRFREQSRASAAVPRERRVCQFCRTKQLEKEMTFTDDLWVCTETGPCMQRWHELQQARRMAAAGK
jgi:hypothetical protein